MTTVLLLILSVSASAEPRPLKVRSFDGFELETAATVPPGQTDEQVKRVVVFIHGSGTQDMDEDLSSVSVPGTKNLFFVDVSNALVGKGFAAVRYNKRSFEMARRVRKDPSFAETETYRRFGRKPLTCLIGDARAVVQWTHKRFPNARIFLFGHSEGTYVGLQESKDDPLVSGAALVGFFAQTLDSAIVEQAVYRNAEDFDALDKNHDGALDESELAGEEPLQKQLRAQLALLDLNQDGKIQRSEFMAGNYANFLEDDPSTHVREYRQEEAALPRPASIVAKANFPILFFQGEWDNQTPIYAVEAVQLMNTLKWHKPDLYFHYFAGLGHALDKRDSYRDIVFRKIDPEALAAVASELDSAWRVPN